MAEHAPPLSTNEYGTPVSVHVCATCGAPFTVCPAIAEEEAHAWEDCLAPNCPSYDPERDVDKLFEEEPWRISRDD